MVVRNYEFVSFLVRLLTHCFHGVYCIILGIYWALSDFIDQYGDLCLMIIKGVIMSVEIFVQMIINWITVIVQASQMVIAVVKFVWQIPFFLWRVVTATFETFNRFICFGGSAPGMILDTIVDGFSMMGTLLIGLIRAIFGLILVFASAMLGLVQTCVVGAFGIFGRKSIDKEFLSNEAATMSTRTFTVEMCIGVIICLSTYLIYVERTRCFWAFRMLTITIRRRAFPLWIRIRNMIAVLCLYITTIRTYFRSRPTNMVNDPNRDAPALRRLPLNQRLNNDLAADTSTDRTSRRDVATSPDSMRRVPLDADLDRFMCVVCQDADKTIMVDSCRHVCMCRPCAELVFREQRRCPICRHFIISLTDVYL